MRGGSVYQYQFMQLNPEPYAPASLHRGRGYSSRTHAATQVSVVPVNNLDLMSNLQVTSYLFIKKRMLLIAILFIEI